MIFNKNKKGYSTGFSWIVGLIALLAMGILYIVFDQVMTTELLPISQSLLNQSPYLNATEFADAQDYQNKGIAYWSFVKYIILFIVLLYLILAGLRSGSQDNL